VLGEARGKHDAEAVDAGTGLGSNTEMPFCSPGSTSRPMNLGRGRGGGDSEHELSAALLSNACLRTGRAPNGGSIWHQAKHLDDGARGNARWHVRERMGTSCEDP
jgi:hypothetical protein